MAAEDDTTGQEASGGDQDKGTGGDQLGPSGTAALKAERSRAKAAERDLAAARARLAEIDEAGKSEAERVAARLAEAESTAAQAEARALRLEVAAEKGLTPAQAKRLIGGSREELEADADELLATFAPAPPPKGPRPDPTQGSKGKDAAVDLDTQIAAAQRAGDWRQVISLNSQKLAASAAARKDQR